MSVETVKNLGDPDCICGGTGLVCRLGVDLKPDPESIAICDCVPRTIRSATFDELSRAADALENDPSVDPGTYIHDVRTAILRALRESDD